jgi:hypothetical protein
MSYSSYSVSDSTSPNQSLPPLSNRAVAKSQPLDVFSSADFSQSSDFSKFVNPVVPSQPVSNISRLLEGERYNGRVNIVMAEEDPETRFKMHEKITIKNKASNYFESLNGSWEWNVLAQVYFSAENIQIVQNGIRAGVYRMSEGKYNVPPQNIDNVKIIMRSIYMQYAEHYPKDITGQVERLNQLVLEYAVPNVFNEAVAYFKYVQDQSTLAVPMDRPNQNDRTYKQLEPNPWI